MATSGDPRLSEEAMKEYATGNPTVEYAALIDHVSHAAAREQAGMLYDGVKIDDNLLEMLCLRLVQDVLRDNGEVRIGGKVFSAASKIMECTQELKHFFKFLQKDVWRLVKRCRDPKTRNVTAFPFLLSANIVFTPADSVEFMDENGMTLAEKFVNFVRCTLVPLYIREQLESKGLAGLLWSSDLMSSDGEDMWGEGEDRMVDGSGGDPKYEQDVVLPVITVGNTVAGQGFTDRERGQMGLSQYDVEISIEKYGIAITVMGSVLMPSMVPVQVMVRVY